LIVDTCIMQFCEVFVVGDVHIGQISE
jgi:hypothetical protein